MNELKGLQVKAELDKLTDPSPAFAQLLMMENKKDDEGEKMQDTETLIDTSRSKLCDLFAKIERARPAVHQRTIELARRLQIVQKQGASPNSGNQNSQKQDASNPEQSSGNKNQTQKTVQTTSGQRL